MSWRKIALLALALGCSERGAEATNPESRQCADASAKTGALECLNRIADDADWQSLSVPVPAVDQIRATKYLLPAKTSARLDALFMNASRHELHYDFMVEVFPELFPGLTPKQYLELLFDPQLREYYAGSLTEYRSTDGSSRFGFTVAGDPAAPESVTCNDVRAVQRGLLALVPASSLAVVPSDNAQLESFPGCGVPFIDPTALEYEAYHRGTAFGRVRRFRPAELAAAVDAAEIGYQDLLVLQQAPSDVETIVSGVVSGTRQAPLSHVAVRSASRGTPNCYLKDAYAYFEAWQGKLVRLECAAQGLLVQEASLEDAQAYWQRLRPEPVSIPEPDRDYEDLVALEDVPLATAAERELGTARFGAKGRNLAWLRQQLDPALTPPGFVVPVAHYLRFIEAGSWQVDLGDGEAQHSFAETLRAWDSDDSFRSDAALRRTRLLALQEALKGAACDAALLASLQQKISEVFGAATTAVRFRSSSNAEDGAFFNGAGLYDSFTGCIADDLDSDDAGPSACDPSEPEERGACRALRKVWASLHNPKAYDERAFYGIDPTRVAMGVLVNERTPDELANLVAFSGNPLVKSDKRYLVNAQIGELPVVSPEPGMWPEQDLLTIAEGTVSEIERALGSSELPEGEYVLSDSELEALGRHLAFIADEYPLDVDAPEGRTFLVDTEWKLMPDHSLRVKQVRPFLK